MTDIICEYCGHVPDNVDPTAKGYICSYCAAQMAIQIDKTIEKGKKK